MTARSPPSEAPLASGKSRSEQVLCRAELQAGQGRIPSRKVLQQQEACGFLSLCRRGPGMLLGSQSGFLRHSGCSERWLVAARWSQVDSALQQGNRHPVTTAQGKDRGSFHPSGECRSGSPAPAAKPLKQPPRMGGGGAGAEMCGLSQDLHWQERQR